MELKSNEYQIECTPYGEYYAFLTDYHQCCTYGETAEELSLIHITEPTRRSYMSYAVFCL